MATIPYKLEEITSEYSLFRDNQVLTAEQLNEIVHYFEDQRRLNRILLTGVGRICGFEMNWDSEEGKITLSKGVGVTTDGDLIHYCDEQTFTQYKAFEDENARYPHFFNGDAQYDMWELFPEDTDSEEVPGLASFSGFQSDTSVNPNSLALILYTENFGKSPDICTKLDCDNQGDRQINTIHALLIKKTDLESIIQNTDSIFRSCRKAGNRFFDLPKVAVPRVILNKSRTSSFDNLANAYIKNIKNTLGPLQTGINFMLDGFKWLIDPKNQTTISGIQARMVQIFQTELQSPDLDVQYRYDLFRDVLQTYGELRNQLHDLCIFCCPDVKAFPKHLMVRELQVTDEHKSQYRHNFYPSPAVTYGDERIREVHFLFQRLYALLFNYQKKLNTNIRFTPSRLPDDDLGDRAIPFYLNANIRNVWNERFTRFHREDEHLSYMASNYSTIEPVVDPLKYDLSPYNFIRIEGHIGQSFNSAITFISNQIQSSQLPVEVIGLRLGDIADGIDLNEYECYFEDLLVILRAWQEEQKCVWSAISKFFSGFYLREAESHKEYGSRIITESSKGTKETSKETKNESDKKSSRAKDKIHEDFYYVGERQKQPLFVGYEKANYLVGVGDYQQYVGNVVEDNLVTDDDYVGAVFQGVINNHGDASYAEIKDFAINQIEEIPEVQNWDEELYEMAVDIPVNMLALAYEINRQKPATINELDVEKLDVFKVSMDRMCQNIKGWQSKMSKYFYRTGYTKVGYEDKYEQLLAQVAVNCCAADKLEILLEEIERRKVKILEMTMLSKYIEKHPGLEHMAGVPMGGTFVLVYKGRSKPAQQEAVVSASNILIADKQKEERLIANMMRGTKSSSASKKEATKKTKEEDAVNYMMKMMAKKGQPQPLMYDENVMRGYVEKQDYNSVQNYIRELFAEGVQAADVPVADNQVVADFALPYLCCSDCPPMSFIVPKEKVTLLIRDHICYEEGMEPVPITVVPEDGEVKTDKGSDMVYKNEAGKWVFDPDKLTDDLFGEVINFTVNEQITDATTIVFHKPQPAIEMSEIQCDLKKGIAIVTFKNNTPLITGFEFDFEWNFGDGTTVESSSLLITHIYKDITPNKAVTFDVTLTATNVRCTTTTDPLSVEVLCEEDEPEEPQCLDVALENFEKIKEEFESIDEKDIPDFAGNIYIQVKDIFATVENDQEAVYNGVFNANLFPQITALLNDIASLMMEMDSAEGRKALSTIWGLLLQLLLNILRCQDLDITDVQKELHDFFTNQLVNQIQQLTNTGIKLDEDKSLRTYIDAYLQSMESDRGVLKIQLEKTIELLDMNDEA